MADKIPSLKEIYSNVKSLLPQINVTSKIDQEVRRLSDTLVGLLQTLDDTYKYNFKRDIPYVSDINNASYADFQTWKDIMNKYVHSGMQFIVRVLVQHNDEDALSFYLDYHDNLFRKAESVERLLSASNSITEEIANRKTEVDRLVNSAKNDKNELTVLLSDVKSTETKIETLNKTIADLSNKTALLEGIKNFEELAKSYKKSSSWWATFAIAVTVSLISFAW